MQRKDNAGNDFAIVPRPKNLVGSLRAFNHILLAAAAAKRDFDAKGYRGELGLAIPLFPTLTAEGANASDRTAAELADGVLNRWFLDPMFKGSYPQDVIEAAHKLGDDIDIRPGDAATIKAAHFDYLGVNYYAPLFIRRPAGGDAGGYAAESFLPSGTYAANNGAVRPDQFKRLLDRIRTDYGNPPVYITENGAGFPGEDKLVNGAIQDEKRCRYLVDHIAAMRSAINDGADVRGYHVWSSHDNLEWLFGYKSRFGIIYVDFDTQKRTPKLSANIYAKIIAGAPVSDQNCVPEPAP